jgi:DNA (cytosine-5)-methyltransferase 1
MSMVYGDVCTGIAAASVAWHPLGWRPAFFSEIEPFPCKLLKHHYPHVPNLGDMTKLLENQTFLNAVIDLLVGGTPCQSFSLAGLRGGLADGRGNLALQYCRLLLAKRPRWFVWENVPGVFSSFSDETEGFNLSGEGREHGQTITETSDFATLLTAFRECGYSCAWRILDSQFFGVPQRRRRVFVVGYFGDDWRPPAAVLFEPKGVRGNNKTIKKTEQDIAGTVNACTSRSRGAGIDPGLIVPCWWDGGQISQTLDAVLYKGQTMPEKNRFPAVLWSIMPQNSGKDYKAKIANVTQPIVTKQGFGNQGGDVVQNDLNVRRLTPLECERLQGFPDNYTAIPGAADGPRYKSLGNSMTTHVMHWIGRRIDTVNKLLHV